MMLFLTSLDQRANQREFSCWLTSLEANFDFLTTIVARGDTLLSAYLIQDDSRTDLPIAAFDGLPLSVGIEALQQEWQSILNQPDLFTRAHSQEIIQLIRRRIRQYKDDLQTHERMLDWYNDWLQKTNRWGPASEPRKARLLYYYTLQIEKHELEMATARFQASLATNRLNQLLLANVGSII